MESNEGIVEANPIKPIRVLLADDHSLVRAGICALLKAMSNIEVVAQASDGREAIELVERHQPDVAVLDISMNGMNGLEAAQHIHTEFPAVRIVILSVYDSEEYVMQALSAGASGYLIKDSGLTELEFALRAVAEGGLYLSPKVSRHIVSEYARRVGVDSEPKESLTPRQREILKLIAQGLSTQQMAEKLFISIKTVESHRNSLMDKLGIHDVAGLVRYAIRIGLIERDK